MCRHTVAMALGSEMGIMGNGIGCHRNGMAKSVGLQECSEYTKGCGVEVGWQSGELGRSGRF